MSGASGLRPHDHGSLGGGGSLAATAGFANPMIDEDDLIIGGASGVATRFAKGADSEFLTVDPVTHHLAWASAPGGGGFTQQYVGYNTAGGSFDTTHSVAAKSVSVPAGLIVGISAYVKGDNVTLGDFGAAILDDNAGAPGKILAYNYLGLDTTFAAVPQMFVGPTARWLEVPLSLYLTGTTTLWLVIGYNPNGIELAYDGSGVDKTQGNYQGIIGDGLLGNSASTQKFSIRASHIS